jgi:hypothetical protein
VRELVFPKLDQELFAQIWNDAIQGTPKSVRMTDAMLKDLVDFGNRFSKNKLDESVIAISYTNEFAPES